ncbi:Cytochrome c [Pirellulimonas nuda]|uniref:Cytochrome c n=1 Tax=Pirellulimonas nuda TaxID=2528009 RepID=A0A518DIW3_9BACT|nr:c-type cytochrome [Pirellulimonas nuda]QDU91372.1 Cytochrome c [Pirellulimonas nuda]
MTKSLRLVASGLVLLLPSVAVGDDSLPGQQLAEGFRAELVYEVPRDEQGSWVCLAYAGRGRMVASDQTGKLYLVTPSPLGAPAAESRVEQLPLELGMAQGLSVVNGDLYVMVNNQKPKPASGLYRARDTDGDGLWDASELLRAIDGRGEHGPHAVIPSPDGKHLYVCCGNVTKLTEFVDSRVPRVWQEDVLLPRLVDPMKLAPHLMAPGGWIAQCDLDGKNWVLHAIGFRNEYDIAFNDRGDLFSFDADMEYDINTPWYRPTRICHAASGADFGWRNGSGKWRTWYPDSFPPAVEIGPGSPTGIAFGYETHFPEPYRSALFAADWSHGRIFAVHLEQSPETLMYGGTFETFATDTPLPTTDLAVNPEDGALYYTTGGRGVQSALWRIVAEEPVAVVEPVDGSLPRSDELSGAASRPNETLLGPVRVEFVGPAPVDLSPEMMQQALWRIIHLAALGGEQSSGGIESVLRGLKDSSRLVRHTARVALERLPLSRYREGLLSSPQPDDSIDAYLALARAGDKGDAPRVFEVLSRRDWNALDPIGRTALLRTYGVLISRYGLPDANTQAAVADQLRQEFPTGDATVDTAAAAVLMTLGDDPSVAAVVGLLEKTSLETEKIDYAHALTVAKTGWTPELRRRYFEELNGLLAYARNRTMRGYIDQIVTLAEANLDDAGRQAVTEQVAARRAMLTAGDALETRRVVSNWNIAQAMKVVEEDKGPRDLERGRKLFAAARCAECHKHGEVGGAVGPDLSTVGKRFALADLLEAILAPDNVISDQYQQTAFEVDGRVLVGRIVNLQQDKVMISTDFTDPKKYATFKQSDVESQRPSPTSPMPKGLLDVLNKEEMLDLVAFLRSGTDAGVDEN